MATPLLRLLVPIAALTAGAASAQCGQVWGPPSSIAGLDSQVTSMTTWDPDGPGPLPAQLVCGGYMTLAGTVPVANVARWDPATGEWAALGSGTGDPLFALETLANGDVVAGGWLTSAGGAPVSGIARWDGTAWSEFGGGVTGGVFAMCRLPNGDLVVGGRFTAAGGVPAANIARWNGSSWSALGSGTDDDVMALAALPNGDLVAGGRFATAGGLATAHIARWNGTTWSPLGSGCNGQVRALATRPNGDLVAGGYFTTAGGQTALGIARWNGASWTPLGSGCDDAVLSLTTLANGDVIAGGLFDAPASRIARWNGTSWSSLGTGSTLGSVTALQQLPGGLMIAAGQFTSIGGVAARSVGIWNGFAWTATVAGTSGDVYSLHVRGNRDLVAGGPFVALEGVAARGVARWDGSAWHELGGGVDGTVYAFAEAANGDLVVGGGFPSAGGIAADNIARWDGTTWHAIGDADGVVWAFATLPNGDLVAGGSFYEIGGVPARGLARWDGANWSEIGGGLSASIFGIVRVDAVAVMPNGDLVVAGLFDFAGGAPIADLARWDGTAWHAIPGVPPYSLGFGRAVLLVTANGDLLLTGVTFWPSSPSGAGIGMARWDGATWHPVGEGFSIPPSSVLELPDGDLVAGGFFTSAGSQPLDGIARWNGSAWQPIANGLQGGAGGAGAWDLAWLPDGQLWIGGVFSSAGGVPTRSLAVLTSSCPATTATVGSGCPGSGGTSQLVSTAPPWIGSTARLRASGLASPAAVLEVFGLTTTSLPLAEWFAEAAPGCTLWVAPLVTELALATSDSIDVAIAIPDTSTLVGLELHAQMIVAELGPLGAVADLSTTDALRLTVGSF